jgi:magnesium-protoporphyrin O-methyltransferase
MSSCCPTSSSAGTDKFFSKNSKKYIKRFRKKGLAKEQRFLLEGISRSSFTGKTILDIGCGVGGLHLTMLTQGATSAHGIDMSEGMLANARQLSAEMGFGKSTTYLHGDFVEQSSATPRSDIVIMDKVVCCYGDLDVLLERSMEKANSVYALTFPRDRFLVRTVAQSAILFGKLFHWSFSPFWHDWGNMIQMICDNGFNKDYQNQTFLWTVCVFRRRQASPLI